MTTDHNLYIFFFSYHFVSDVRSFLDDDMMMMISMMKMMMVVVTIIHYCVGETISIEI